MKDLREEVGTKAFIVGKIVKSRIKWAGHMVRMKYDKLPKRAETNMHECSRKTRKTTAKMGGLCEERSEKGRVGRKMERKGKQQGPTESNHESIRTSK